MKPKSEKQSKLHLKKMTIHKLSKVFAGARETVTTMSEGGSVFICPTCDHCLTIQTCITCNGCPREELAA
jgi:hypothetical protein